MSELKKENVTVLLTAGRLPLEIMGAAYKLAEKHFLQVYFSNMQNLRFNDVPENIVEEIKDTLTPLGARYKAPGKFPVPRVCEGKDRCNLGIIDTEDLSNKILDKFGGREKTKGKFKITLAGCTVCCSNPKTVDIGIVATRAGYEVYAGGKGGQLPKIGKRIQKNVSEDTVLNVIEVLVDFHDRKTKKKQRIYKLLADPEFPYDEI